MSGGDQYSNAPAFVFLRRKRQWPAAATVQIRRVYLASLVWDWLEVPSHVSRQAATMSLQTSTVSDKRHEPVISDNGRRISDDGATKTPPAPYKGGQHREKCRALRITDKRFAYPRRMSLLCREFRKKCGAPLFKLIRYRNRGRSPRFYFIDRGCATTKGGFAARLSYANRSCGVGETGCRISDAVAASAPAAAHLRSSNHGCLPGSVKSSAIAASINISFHMYAKPSPLSMIALMMM